MARLQNALTKQLTDEHERVDLSLREKEEEVRKIRQDREETGVQLYGVQHQLARMQTTFERTHDNYNIVQRYRTEAERQHEILQRQYESKKEEADEQLKRVLKAQEELNQLNRTLKQVEEYNEVMKSEIAVTRRTTYRAEENVTNLEKAKKKQDLLHEIIISALLQDVFKLKSALKRCRRNFWEGKKNSIEKRIVCLVAISSGEGIFDLVEARGWIDELKAVESELDVRYRRGELAEAEFALR